LERTTKEDRNNKRRNKDSYGKDKRHDEKAI